MKYFTFLLLFFTILSCSNDDDINSSGLEGKWNLVNSSGGAGINHDFANGIIVWDFNETNKMITITNTNTDSAINDILSSGVYTYSITTVQDKKEIVINNVSRGNFELTNNQFIISEQNRDGFRFVFKRNL